MKREQWLYAGAFFGYAVSTKLFPLFFGVTLLVRAGLLWRREGVFPQRYRQFAIGTVASGAFFVAVATVMFGFGAWSEYKDRIQVAQVEKFYAIQYSLKTVYLQAAESRDGDFLKEGLWPKEIKQPLPHVDIENHKGEFFFLRLFFTLAVLALVLRAGDLEAFTLGPLLVFTWLTVNMYYWNMLGFTALGFALRKERTGLGALLGLHFIFGFFYLYQHTNHGAAEGFAVACLLALGILGAAGYELWALRGRLGEYFTPAKSKAA
jgi:hypothetical protein